MYRFAAVGEEGVKKVLSTQPCGTLLPRIRVEEQ